MGVLVKTWMDFKKMKHIKAISVFANAPARAIGAGEIVFIVGTVFSGLGTIMIAVSSFLGGPKE
jgi:hypothetical protein